MSRPLLLLSLLVFPASFLTAGATLTGKVRLPPAPPAPVVTQRYEITNHDGVVRVNPPTAVVYLEGHFPPAPFPPVAQVTQKDLSFDPSLLAIRVGTKVEFPNEDDTFHNVFSFSATKRFDLGRYQPNELPVPSQTFETAGLVTLRCEIHQHMRGLILVLDTPHFVRTELNGTYRLTDLPAGKYTVKAWVDSKTTLAQEIELRDGETSTVNFE